MISKTVTRNYYRRSDQLYHQHEVWKTMLIDMIHPNSLATAAAAIEGIPAPANCLWVISSYNGPPHGDGWQIDASVQRHEYAQYVAREKLLGRLLWLVDV